MDEIVILRNVMNGIFGDVFCHVAGKEIQGKGMKIAILSGPRELNAGP
jgi:hypothetical protein